MKNNPILKLIRLVMIIPVLLQFSSCHQEESYSMPSTGTTPVTLSVSVSNNQTPASGDAASAIKNLCILQFYADNDGGFGNLRHAGMCTLNDAGTKYQTRLLQSNYGEKYKLVVVANLPRHGFVYYQDLIGKSYTEIQKELLSEISETMLDFSAGTPFPMFGIPGDGTAQTIGETLNLGNVSLVRAVARVDIGIGKKNPDANIWSKNGVKFNMTEVQIWKAGKQYTYMPETNAFTSSGGELTITKPSPFPNGGVTESIIYTDIAEGTYCSEKIYVPEAFLDWGDVYDSKHTQRVAIIVKGRYDNSANETYYRVDFTNDQTDEKMDILRNHVYQFTIKNVTDDGYATAELAYKSIPRNMGFTATLVPWTISDPVSVPSIVGYYISYKGFNCTNLVWDSSSSPGLSIPKKRYTWINFNYPFDYNDFYTEANNVYVPNVMGGQNGKLYPTVAEAFNNEGVYPSLMISGDDVLDVQGNEAIAWKSGKTLTAFDICRDYEGNGYSDWRLPRLSELALIYLNRTNLEAMRGFIPMDGTYWCGSEYLVSNSNKDKEHSEQAWAIDFNSLNPGNAANHQKTEQLKIRCVRQMQ